MRPGEPKLTDKQKSDIACYLRAELTKAQSDSREYRDNVVLWREFVDPKDTAKTFPWEGASNVFMPIPRMVLDALKASIKQAIMRQRNLFSAEIDSHEACGIEKEQIFTVCAAATRLAEVLARSTNYLNLERVLDEWIEELLTTGTGPVKLVYEHDVRKVITSDGEKTVVLRDGPRIYVVPVGTWVWPAGLWNSVQEMPWIGNWTVLSDAALRLRKAADWGYDPDAVDAVLMAGATGTGTHGEEWEQKLSSIGATPSNMGHRVYEVYLHWPSDPDDPEAPHFDLMVSYSLTADRVLRFAFAPGGDGFKPYDYEVASPRSGTIMGRGFIEPIVQPVRAINTAINQTFDSQTLANAPVLLYPEDGTAASVLADGFAPGIAIPYKESKDEIAVLKIPDPSDTSFTMIYLFQSVIERLSRIGAGRLGDIASTKRTPATLGMQVAQIGGELIDELIDRLRNTTGRLMGRAFILYLKHDPSVFTRILGQEKGTLLRDVVQKAAESQKSVSELLNLRLTASSATRSVELERQNAMTTAQMLFGWYEKSISLVQLYFQSQQDPNMAPVAKEVLLSILKAAQEQMKRIVELANTPDSATLVPDIASMIENAAAPPPPPEGGMPLPPGGMPPTGAAGMPPEVPPEVMMSALGLNEPPSNR